MENQSDQVKTKDVQIKKEETWSDVFRFVALTLLIIIPIRMFIIEPYMVRGESMLPNFENNDYLLTEKLSVWKNIPNYNRGDILIFKSPVEQKRTLIKRIIGLPGETIKIIDGVTMIAKNNDAQGEPIFENLNEPYINSVDDGSFDINLIQLKQSSFNIEPITLKADEFFVMGDNRLASYDSRFWGPLPAENIIGRPIIRLFQFDKIGIWPARFLTE